jgi:hypothetical protein
MDQGILKADRIRRRRAIGMLGATVAFGAVTIQLILPYVTESIKKLPPRQAVWALGGVLVVGFLSVVPVGLYVRLIGRRVVASGRYPAPGMSVLVDTRIIHGNPALAYGRILKALGTVLAVAGLAGCFYTVALLFRLLYR